MTRPTNTNMQALAPTAAPAPPRRRHWRAYPFTITEIMVVLIIIGLILGLVGPAIFSQLESGKQKTAKNQVILLRTSIKTYYLDNGEYPKTLQDLVQDPGSLPKWRGPYLDDRTTVMPDPWGGDFQYSIPGENGRAFDVYSFGKDKAPGGDELNTDIYFDTEL